MSTTNTDQPGAHNIPYGITDVELELLYNRGGAPMPHLLDETCRCGWCASTLDHGFNLNYFNYTICYSCVIKASDVKSWPDWIDATCDYCRKKKLCYHGNAIRNAGDWYLCRDCMDIADNYYGRHQPKKAFIHQMDQFKTYLKLSI